jgi:hypothetical protein
MRINTVALGRAARNAAISGLSEITRAMRKTPSIGQVIEWREVDEGQILGTKIER